jgi:hypothetical protein
VTANRGGEPFPGAGAKSPTTPTSVRSAVTPTTPHARLLASVSRVAVGPTAGTYYGKGGCPPVVTAQNVITLGSSW